MPPPTNKELNDKREQNCIAVTAERKYYRVGDTWIKRSLRPSEWQKHEGYMHVPLLNAERVLNDGAVLAFLASACPSLPLPKLHACFEDDGAAYVVTEYVEGVGMNKLGPEEREVVTKEIRRHLAELKKLTSDTWGGPGGVVLPPYRVMRKSNGRPWRMKKRAQRDLVFCHNDLTTHNVIVNPATLKIAAIVDWEYAGFYPAEFEYPFYYRPGPSVPLEGEVDDVERLMSIIKEERMPRGIVELRKEKEGKEEKDGGGERVSAVELA